MAQRSLTATLSAENSRGVTSTRGRWAAPNMSTETTSRQEPVGTDERITGPHTGFDKYGRADHEYYRCTRCGAEAVRQRDLRWCC